jgi:hypothetical protein
VRPSETTASTAKSGQDPRAELLPLACLLLDTLVVHAWRTDRDRPGANRQLALLGAAVAHHQPPSVLVALVAETLHVLAGLGAERGGNHPPRALPSELVERDRDLLAVPSRERTNIRHQSAFLLRQLHGWRISPGCGHPDD